MKLIELVYPSNHTSVWGSYFDKSSFAWGYSCCHSLLHNSYCVGEAGKAAITSSSAASLLADASDRRKIDAAAEAERKDLESRNKTLVERHQEEMSSKKGKDRERERDRFGDKAKRLDGDEEVEIDKDRLKKALEEEKKRKAMGDDEAWANTKKSKIDVSQEELGECPNLTVLKNDSGS